MASISATIERIKTSFSPGRDAESIADSLHEFRDRLWGGGSLRGALEGAAREPGSPFAGFQDHLDRPVPLADALLDASQEAKTGDMARLLVTLSVHARFGSDPIPSLRSQERDLRARVALQRETQALAAQARMTARIILFMLTPAALAFLLIFNPLNIRPIMGSGVGLFIMIVGVILQIVGMVIIEFVTVGPARSLIPPPAPLVPSWPRPYAANGFHDGDGNGHPNGNGNGHNKKPKPKRNTTVVHGKGSMHSLVLFLVTLCAEGLRAGASPLQALQEAAPVVGGKVGRVVRRAVAEARAGEPLMTTLERSSAALADPDYDRMVRVFKRAIEWGVPLVEGLDYLALDIQRRQQAQSAESARQASVWSVLPLTLITVPGFIIAVGFPLFLAATQQIFTRIGNLA